MVKNYPTLVVNFLYNILFFIVFYIVIEYIIAKIQYSPYERWWKDNNGVAYPGQIDFTSLALFNRSKFLYDIYLFNSYSTMLDHTSIMFIQNVLLNKTYSVDSLGNVLPGRFVKPSHLCNSIAWGTDDKYLWYMNIVKDISFLGYKNNQWYISSCVSDPGTYDCSMPNPDQTAWSQASWSGGNDPVIGLTPLKNVYTDKGSGGGFWPHQYGCTGFFDTPAPADGQTVPTGDEYNPYDLIDKLPCVGTYGYIPGYPGRRGSWAQLFADWGIVYCLRNTSGSSTIAVLSDGLLCKDLYPCTSYCNDKNVDFKGTCLGPATTDMLTCSSATDPNPYSYPKSDTSLWKLSGSGSNGTVAGLNFFSAYNIHPESFLLKSWVSGYFNDASVKKMIFDSYGVMNLLGIDDLGAPLAGGGGWLRFLKGINTKLKNYDELTNELFRQYISNVNPNLQPPPDPECEKINETSRGFNFVKTAAMGFILGPQFAPILLPLSIWYASTHNPSQVCPKLK
uniref:Uncharacterized protein n=1 Tax=viral metagenome TaxID=1070528 RepID=A0A6C0I845_9ZZZZ